MTLLKKKREYILKDGVKSLSYAQNHSFNSINDNIKPTRVKLIKNLMRSGA